MSNTLPRVSIIIPCRNEAGWIERCLASVAANDYPKDRLEILIVDGLSDDGTPAILETLAAEHPHVRVLENPNRTAPAALNIGITEANGDVIMRMDAHNEYSDKYISSLVNWLQRSGADNVGGRWVTQPGDDSVMARAIVVVLTHRFGVGGAHYRFEVNEPRSVDTVPFGCYRRSVFDKIGLFDEELVRNQDLEFNLRLRKHGGSILLVPGAESRYHARTSLRKACRMTFLNAYFSPLVMRKLGGTINIRQLVPAAFVVALVSLGILATLSPLGTAAFALLLAAYLLPAGTIALRAALMHGLRCGMNVFVLFPLIHISHGLGFLKGVLDFIVLRRSYKKKANTMKITR